MPYGLDLSVQDLATMEGGPHTLDHLQPSLHEEAHFRPYAPSSSGS